MSELSRLKLGGHRGMGCTDHDFYQNVRNIAELPVENTLESIQAAFGNGADYIETDAVMSGDGVLFTLHNVVPKDHYFGQAIPDQLLNTMNFSDIEKYQTGRHGKGALARFSEMLELVAKADPKTLPWAINIEIKGVQGSGQNYETNNYLEKLAETVRKSSLNPDRILWSSFSLKNMLTLSHQFPNAHFGMLFAEKPEARGIYADHQDDFHYQYLPFETKYVDMVLASWKTHANPDAILGYVHPEIMTITPDKVDAMHKRNLGINCWALFEEFNQNRTGYYRDITRHAAQSDVPFTIITDYLPEMKRALS